MSDETAQPQTDRDKLTAIQLQLKGIYSQCDDAEICDSLLIAARCIAVALSGYEFNDLLKAERDQDAEMQRIVLYAERNPGKALPVF